MTAIGSISNGPATNFLRVLNTLSLDGTKIPNSFNRFLISCLEKGGKKKGNGYPPFTTRSKMLRCLHDQEHQECINNNARPIPQKNGRTGVAPQYIIM